ncbi:MAG: hypothetical protein RRY78_01595, partial [Clostridia bacterium]
MVLKNSIGILSSKFSLVYKIIIFMLIILLLFTALGFSIIYPTINKPMHEIGELKMFTSIKDGFVSFFSGDLELQETSFATIKSNWQELDNIFDKYGAKFAIAIAVLVVLLFLCVFVLSLSFITNSDIIYNYMTSKSNYGFASNMLANIKRSAIFALFYMLFMLCFMAIMAITVTILVYALYGWLSYFCLPFIYLAIVLIFSIQKALFSNWIPLIICENMTVVQALKENRKLLKRDFKHNLMHYFIYYVISLSFISAFGLFSFGIGFVIGFAIHVVIFQILPLVIYFENNHKRYYINNFKVVEPHIDNLI